MTRVGLGGGLAIGMGMGVALGVAFDNMGLGIGIGVAMGLTFAVVFSAAGSRMRSGDADASISDRESVGDPDDEQDDDGVPDQPR